VGRSSFVQIQSTIYQDLSPANSAGFLLRDEPDEESYKQFQASISDVSRTGKIHEINITFYDNMVIENAGVTGNEDDDESSRLSLEKVLGAAWIM
jgi:hypothetical protein